MSKKRDGPTAEDVKLFTGRAGKVLLDYVRKLSPEKIAKMRGNMRRRGAKMECSFHLPLTETDHRESRGPLRTRTGYVYR